MKKNRHQFTLLLPIALALAFVFSPAYATELTIYIWEDYLSEKVIENFTKETGISIKQVHFDSDQTRDEVVASTGGEKFDLVIFDAVSGMIFGKNDHLLGISKSLIPNITNIDKRWKESCGNFGVPYSYGTVGILYDKTKTTPPKSWSDLLNPSKEHQGHIGMIKDMTDTLIPALLYLGYNLNSEKEVELKKAYELLRQQVKFVSSYDYAISAIQSTDEIKKDIHLALGFSGDQYTLNELSGTENWEYVIPQEGTALWVDCMAIPRKSENQKEALAFLNYLYTPQAAADTTEDLYIPTAISAARELLSEETANDADIFPSEEQLSNAQMYRILSDSNLQQRRRILDALIKQHEAQ
ncbi:MAG: spermidine/putrescine transport system substrate-binding protein [Desulforhopalus sp.]|jgi:spermidine/putrescine transport system substrate-binding protein